MSGQPEQETRRPLLAVVFDLDGVVTRTARLHIASWKRLFDDYLRSRAERLGEPFRPFDPGADYRAHVDGRPRYEGVHAFLASRGIHLPAGTPEDPPEAETEAGLGNRKNGLFQQQVEREGVEVDPAAVALIHALRARGVRVGVASSSKNTESILRRAGLSELFEARVDGVLSARLGLRGKPHPDIFLECLKQLGDVDPRHAVVLEDSAAGVRAGMAGGFGLVIGVDRGGNEKRLREAGADWIFQELSRLSPARMEDYLSAQAHPEGAAMTDPWVLSFEGLDAEHEGLREALCTLGNGCFATRGAAEEQRANGTHYPGTYVAGGYNALSSEVAGHTVVNEDLVNFTNWLWLTFRPGDGDWLELGTLEVLDYRQELHLREGLLVRRFRVSDAKGRVTAVESRRLVHMGKPHLAALEQRITPENWSGELIFRSGLDGSVTNAGVARYRQLNDKHLEVVTRGTVAPEGIYLLTRTSQSRFEVAEAARTRVFRDAQALPVDRHILQNHPEQIAEEFRVYVKSGEPLRVEKVVALCTSRDRGISESAGAARLAIGSAPGFDALLTSHRKAWERLWHRHDVEIDSVENGQDQLILRLHIFHLLQTASPNTVGRDMGVPARGLHGEAYRGHVFWDELFILPFFAWRNPSLARTLLLYRYHRLDAARALARAEGHAGAAFPWQSSSDGREATQQLHLNPLSGRWGPDYSHLQRHVNAAITYNVWKYYEAVGDRAFLEEYGAELMLEIARFWSSLAQWNERKGRYEIIGVMGPDEYHEKYPDAEAGGLRNNAYTNVMAVWCLLRALDVLELIAADRRAELLDMLEIDAAELQRWQDITERMTVIFHDGVISQFEGYAELEEFDWAGYLQRYGNIERLDRILKAEGISPDRYKASKQADVIMLFYLFRPTELRALFERLGYPFDEDAIRRNVEYYQARTSHGSTLSKVVFTSVVHRQDCAEGCKLFLSALRSDLYDIQGGTTAEGVHLGAMAGTVDILMRHYAGLELTREGISIWPEMPERLRRVRFRVQYHGRWLEVEFTREHLRVALDATEPGSIPVCLQGVWHQLPSGGALEVALPPPSYRQAPGEPLPEPRVHVDVSRFGGGPPSPRPVAS